MAHRSYTFDELKTISAKHTTVVTQESDSGKLLFTSYGARLLGLFPRADAENALWADANLDSNMAAGQWMIGGERLWLAPERDFFYENPRDFEGFHVPASIDPGEFSIIGELEYENALPLLDYTRNKTYEGSLMRRSFQQISDPYSTGLAYAGVSIRDTISLPSSNIDVCAWSLCQVYTCGKDAPGTACFPVKPGAEIVNYFNEIPTDRADVQNGYARFKIDATSIHKLGIKPEDMLFANPCKAFYISPYPDGSSYFCLVKRSTDMPQSQSECVDIPLNDPDGPKGAIQSYNSGPEEGKPETPFGEIELQLTKGSTIDGRTVSQAKHELLAYAGSKNEVLELAKMVLQLGTTPQLY